MLLPLTAELGCTQITLGEARGLRASDIIWSATTVTCPVVLLVEEELKFLAGAFAGDDGKQSLKVGSVIPARY